MTNVSKKKLKEEIHQRIRKQFFSILGELKNSSNAKGFIGDFFTPAEETMFYKRLSVIFMLNNSLSPTTIRNTLKVSYDTISKISNTLEKGGYDDILKSVKKHSKKDDFSIDLEVLLRMGMPPIVGRGRWKFLDDYLAKKKSAKLAKSAKSKK